MFHKKLQNAIAILREIDAAPGVQAAEIAKSLDCGLGLIEQTIRPLVSNQYVGSRRGPGGGYWMEVDLPSITLYELGRDLCCDECRIKYSDSAKRAITIGVVLR